MRYSSPDYHPEVEELLQPKGVLHVRDNGTWTTIRFKTLRAARLAAYLLNRDGRTAYATR